MSQLHDQSQQHLNQWSARYYCDAHLNLLGPDWVLLILLSQLFILGQLFISAMILLRS